MSDAIERLHSALTAALEESYRRGETDAISRLVEAAKIAVPIAMKPASSNGASKTRAPRGAPDALVMRVLTETAPQGASSLEIEQMAASKDERRVSQSAIRFALDRGRTAGKYANDGGKWFIVDLA